MKRIVAVTALASIAVLGGPATTAFAAGHATRHAIRRNLPGDAPRALYKAEPRLPKAKGWPGPNNAYSRTSGTGRYADGGFFWTDFLYDDHGTTTVSPGDPSVTAGSPSFGLYTYPNGPASENGADIFRAAVLKRQHATYWRVDWNTLKRTTVPIAEWTFDRDNKASTGGSTWPAKAGVHSPGIDTALVMSYSGARIINVKTGKVTAKLPVHVDKRSRSFVARIPNRLLHPTGKWRIRLAAGLANSSGTAFTPAADALPDETAVYNVTFRTRAQEPLSDDFWDDETQTSHLAVGNVTPFSHVIRWKALAHHRRTPQPLIRGWSDRWYVSDVSLGPGIITAPQTIEDNQANYLGRVQPYAVYIPKSYRPSRPAPLTFLLHSLTQNQNQYAATTPHFTREACEARHSICATTLGRGPDGFFYGTAQLDFWQVWHSLAASYRLNPNRTILSGYSMGGIGTNQIAMAHPDLFAAAITLAGAVGDVGSLSNLRWVPMYQAGGVEDELVPITVQRAEAQALTDLGYRHRWVLYPAIDHVAFELADSFSDAATYMGHAHRTRHPGKFSFTWVPHDSTNAFPSGQKGLAGFRWTQQPKLGITTTGDYWLRHLHARDRSADSARVGARSGERPMPKITTHTTGTVVPDLSGLGPAHVQTLTWTRHPSHARHAVIRLTLTNVRALQVKTRGAGFSHSQHGKLVVRSDGRTKIRIAGRTLHVRKGRHVVRFIA